MATAFITQKKGNKEFIIIPYYRDMLKSLHVSVYRKYSKKSPDKIQEGWIGGESEAETMAILRAKIEEKKHKIIREF